MGAFYGTRITQLLEAENRIVVERKSGITDGRMACT